MKYSILFLGCLLSMVGVAQEAVTLEACQAAAERIAPALREQVWIGQRLEQELKASHTLWLPQLVANAQASYQSDVPHLPVALPNASIEALSKDQYKASLDLTQMVWDGGVVAGQRAVKRASAAVERQQRVVSLYQLKERVMGTYLAVLLMEKQREVLELQRETLQATLRRMEALVANGVALRGELSKLEVEQLRVEQQLLQCRYGRKGLMATLATLTGLELEEGTLLELPTVEGVVSQDGVLHRPEYRLFELQRDALGEQSKLIRGGVLPKVSLFATGGYGLPGLNMLRNEFAWYYMAGVRLTVPITGWITGSHERKAVGIQQQLVEESRSAYDQNLCIELDRQRVDLERLQEMVSSDVQLIVHRAAIQQEAFAQLEQGVITASDYLVELNQESAARLQYELHRIEALQGALKLRLLMGVE